MRDVVLRAREARGEHELKGVVDLLHMRAWLSPEAERESKPAEIPSDIAAQAGEYRVKLVEAVVDPGQGPALGHP